MNYGPLFDGSVPFVAVDVRRQRSGCGWCCCLKRIRNSVLFRTNKFT